MKDHVLVAHGGDAAAVRAVAARAELVASTVRFEYRLRGELAALAIPHRAAPRRVDRLWEHTCFEAFVAPAAGAPYYELNFSPSTEWAAYAFDDYRQGMRPLSLARAPAIAVAATDDELLVTAGIEVAALAGAQWPWRIGLTAVVEDRAGGRAYFALAHPRENPDFHDAAGFVVLLDGRSP